MGVGRTTRLARNNGTGLEIGARGPRRLQVDVLLPQGGQFLHPHPSVVRNPLSGVHVEGDGDIAGMEVEGRDGSDLDSPVGDIRPGIEASGSRHQNGDRERLRRDAVLHDVEHDVVDADDDDDDQGDHPRYQAPAHDTIPVMTDSP